MLAVIYRAPGDIVVDDIPPPTLESDTDALVAVKLAGICGTDLHAAAGDLPGIDPGTVLGHEFVGVIVDVGAAVRRLQPGDRVMSSDFAACGHCWWCDRGDHWHCKQRQFFGTGTAFGPPLAGAQAELVRVPFADTTLATLPGTLDPDAALLIGDNLATGWVANQQAGTQPGDIVVIIGGGPVGQMASLSAQVCGAAIVVVSDPVEDRRDFANTQGALAAAPDALSDLVKQVTDGRGADVVLEAVGGPRGLDAAIDVVRPGGRIISVSAHSQPSWDFPLARAFTSELNLGFAIGNSIRVRGRLASLIEAGVLDPTPIITGRRSIADAAGGYREMRTQQEYKVVLDIGLK